MPDDKSISVVNLRELSKPADTLIKKVSSAIGGIFEPWQIKRVAKAQAEASLIRAKAEIEITDLHRRAMHRFVEEEAKRQENMESITRRALPQLEDGSDPSKMEDDWVTNYFDKSRIISDTDMQELWARVLAGEANSPGSYSKRTVNFLASLDKADANLFTSLCGFGWLIAGNIRLLIFDADNAMYDDRGINFDCLNHLDDIGLVSHEHIAGFLDTKLPKRITVQYHGSILHIEFNNEADNELPLGQVILTKTGEQLAGICGAKPVDGFQDYVIEQWKTRNLVIS
ncbi:MAG: DUF2806 domain-containing protein [Desulforhabdus sp.]|jgi:hypothetical protein|nr:DUF2806 domain-containing protein [Desulforhabdus sp.]